MKPEKKPFVVEFKNRRRQATRQNSIWGAIDLKAASKEVAAKKMAGEVDASTVKQRSDVSADENIADLGV
ncbi:hypothetical protein [Agrobacterium sp.]|uniref:hypothetical protein n=1 Tax=Agrobacterium sp. TaxID=361 RepID=UPI0028A8CFEE|nr:hypothetical protein [Agrobacterium sp.]